VSEQTQTDQTQPDQAQPDQTQPDQAQPDQTQPDQAEANPGPSPEPDAELEDEDLDPVELEAARVFGRGFTGAEKRLSDRFESLGRALLRALPPGQGQQVAVRKLLKTRDAALRALRAA